jgi:antagonist of KipI
MSLTVLEPGPCSLVVDLGRPHHRSLGVPIGGAADRATFLQGNALVGNDNNAAAIEFALAGPRLQANVDVGAVVFGPPFAAWLDDRPIKIDTTFLWRAGTTLRIGDTSAGLRGYLCIVGGIQTKKILGSRTAFEPLQRNEVLPCMTSRVAVRSIHAPIATYYPTDKVADTLWCLSGPQADWFSGQQFFGESFTVTPLSNRMGLRLSGKPLRLPDRELVSEPACPGSVQVTNDGQCVILGVDGQTIGGYPKIAQVINSDFDALGQLRPGQPISFELVTRYRAEVQHEQRERILRNQVIRIRTGVKAAKL